MAKQLGVFPIGGSLDQVTFYQAADGSFGVRKKSKLTGALMATMPAFERLREHNREFGNAGKAVKVIRKAVKSLIANTADRESTQRLQQVLFAALKKDQTSNRGERKPQHGDLGLLKGFDFNKRAALDTVLDARFVSSINRTTGICSISFPTFSPKRLLKGPSQATHFNVRLLAAGVDFTNEAVETDLVEIEKQLICELAVPTTSLNAQLRPNTAKHVLLVISIGFYQMSNGIEYPLQSCSPVTIIDVSQQGSYSVSWS